MSASGWGTGRTERIEEKQPSIAVVEALADAEGVAPERLEVRLWDAVDPDALDAFLAADDCEVRFSVGDYDVTVRSADGETRVRLRDA